jgi:HK97 family phage portal protein
MTFGSKILARKAGPVPSFPPRVYIQGTTSTVVPRATENTVRDISAYRRGQRLISRTIGMMPLTLERGEVRTDETLPLLQRPVPWMSRQAAIESMVETLIDWGNYFALFTQFDSLGRPQGIIPVHPKFVGVALTTQGLVYRLGTEYYNAADVMHLRTGGPANDLLGRGVLETSPTAIKTGTSVSNATSYFYGDAVYPAGILQVDGDPGPDEAEALRDTFISKVRRGQPVVLPNYIEWKPATAPNAEESQLAEATHLSRQQVADLLDLDGDWLGVPSKSLTYANIVDRVENLVRLTCMPWMAAIEDAFTNATSRPTRVRFDTDELLRYDTATRYANYSVGIVGGWLTRNEVRDEEGLPPLPNTPPEPPGEDPPAGEPNGGAL